MNVEFLKKETLFCELQITVPANDIEQVRQAELKKVGAGVSLPGFRKGKVPMEILNARYGQSVMGEVLDQIVQTSSFKALDDNKLRPALQPKVEVKSFDPGKDLVYTIAVDILPEVTVVDLKTLKVTRPVTAVENSVIDEALGRIAEQNGEPTDLPTPRATQKDDLIKMDFVGKTDAGVALPGMSATDFNLRLGSNSLIPGFEDQLIGKNVGDTVMVKVTFPADYHETSLAGQPATFETTIKSIQAFTVPAIDDDFAKKLGFEDVAKLRAAIENQIKSDYTRHSKMKAKRSLLDALDTAHKIDLPTGLIDLEHKQIIDQMEAEAHAAAHGDHEHAHDHNHEHHSHLTENDKAELRKIAERRVRLGLVLAEVGRANNISVNEGELQRAMFTEASKYRGQEKMVLEYFRKNRQAVEGLRAPLFEEKVVDFMMELVNVTEVNVSVEDLLKPEEDGFKPESAGDTTADKPAKKSAKKKEAS